MKSMITALWERSQRKKQIDERINRASRDFDSRCSFEIERGAEPEPGHFLLTDDTSLLHEGGAEADFGLCIAGNWRFEMGADSESGRCVKLTAFMSQLTAKRRVLEIPDAEPGRLIFRSESLEPDVCETVGCPDNAVYFDPNEKILCIGDPEAVGDAVEFCEGVCAVVDGGKLRAVYLDLRDVKIAPDSGISLSNCIILV